MAEIPRVKARFLQIIRSLARRNNRMQREEILTLQSFLLQWYGVQYQPKVRDESRRMLAILDRTSAGADFDHAFLEVFSRHHYTLIEPVDACLTGNDLMHEDLRRACRGMWHSQISDIETMREELKRHFNIVDYQPFQGLQPLQPSPADPRGRHSGGD